MSEGEISSSERATCPKCGHKRDKGASACPRCGLRFALWRPSLADPRTHLSPQGQELWQQVEANWQDVARHEEFAKYCLQSNLLPAAGRCYRDRLDRFPGDAIAAKMQAEILAKATLGLMVQQRQAAEPVTRSKWFWVIILAAMALAIAAALVWGPGGVRARSRPTPTINLQLPR
jgi:hypothetical protein